MMDRKKSHPVYPQTCDGCGREWFASKGCWECPWCGLLARRRSWGGRGILAEYDGGRGHKTYQDAKRYQGDDGETGDDGTDSERDILVRWEEDDRFDYDRYFT